MLEALARSFEPGATVGEIVDAAAALGWTDLGELSLSDLADALLTDATVAAATETARPAEPDTAADEGDDEDDADEDDADDEAEDDEAEDDEVDEDEAPVKPAKAARGRRVAAAPAKATKAAKPAAKPTKAVAAKPAAKPTKAGKPAKVSLDDRMSLDEAAAVLLPLVRTLGEATMQQLEQSTAGAGRRKLRFHIGQLVKNGRLERHGMGRGTFYTLT